MAIIINDDKREKQYTAAAAQDTFPYTFSIFTDQDLNVYQTLSGNEPDPDTDLLPTTAYTVNINPLNDNKGDVILNTPASSGDIITITSNVQKTQLIDYSVGGVATTESINNFYDKTTVIIQDVNNAIECRGLTYNATDVLKPNRLDNRLPVLQDGEIWKMTVNGLQPAVSDEIPNTTALRNELLSTTSGADGASIVGYDSIPNGATTVEAELDYLFNQLSVEEFKSKVSATDATAEFLDAKIVAGAGIQINPLFGGGNEQLEIQSTGESGKVLQVVLETFGASFSFSSNQIPVDTSVPQIIEGNLLLSAQITPISATSNILIEFGSPSILLQTSLSSEVYAIFRVGQSEALSSGIVDQTTQTHHNYIGLTILDSAGGVSPIDYQIRVGRLERFNRLGSSQFSFLKLTEIAA